MPGQTTIQLQGQTYLGCGVSLNCMWSHSVESKGRERDPTCRLCHTMHGHLHSGIQRNQEDHIEQGECTV